jgi:hypothetical protein
MKRRLLFLEERAESNQLQQTFEQIQEDCRVENE